MTVGWGIVTAGRHPDQKIVPAIKQAEGARGIAVYSRDKNRAQAFAQKHDLSAAYDSMTDLLRDPRIDAVFIASPNYLHMEHACRAAQAGKHILVEKPMALDPQEAKEMVLTCRKHGVKLGVGFQLRHHPGILKARQLVREGILGMITMAQAQFFFLNRRGVTERPERSSLTQWWDTPEKIGGSFSLMGMGVHAIDALQFILDQPVIEVAAITDGQTETKALDDTAALVLRFRNGIIGTVCCGRFAPDTRNDAVVYGSHGRILLENALWERRDGTLSVASESIDFSESYEPDLLALYKREIEAFGEALGNGEKFSASGEDGFHVVQVTTAGISSAATGCTVKIEPVRI